MLHVSVGGMQLRAGWRYFPMIWRTIQVLRAARKSEGCVHADIFKMRGYYIAFSVWQNAKDMKAFAHEGLQGDLMATASRDMKFFKNVSFSCPAVPTNGEAFQMWFQAVFGKPTN